MLSNPTQPPEWQARGYHARGKLAVAVGQLQLAESEFRTAQSDFPALMLAQRVLRAAMPAFPVDRDKLESLRSEVARWDTTEAPLTTLSGGDLHSGSQAAVKTFLLGLLDFRAGDWDAARQKLLSLERQGGRDAESFAKTLRVFMAWHSGRNNEALHLLDAAQVQVFFRLAAQSPFYHQSLSRYVRAEILFTEGRYKEANDWYASLVDNNFVSWGFNYLGPSYLRRAECYEKLGDTDKAIEFYGRFVDLWQNCDPELRPMLDDAKQKRERLLLESVKEPVEKQKQLQTETKQ
ncbi:MAG: tol-pal system YbgF family protein [bacterium]